MYSGLAEYLLAS